MLGEVPGLAAAVADAGQFPLLEQLLYRSSDLPAAELAALLQVLLSPPSGDAAQQGRQARHQTAEAAAAAALEDSDKTASGQHVQQQAAQQQADQQPQPGGKAGRRPRRKAAVADSDGSDAEDLAAPMDATLGAGEQQGAAGPADAAQQQQVPLVAGMAAPGARERAIATCCSAAVEGFAPADICLHPLLLVRHRPAVLRQALRGLGALQALQLLRYLAALLRTHAARVGGLAAGWQPALLLPPGVALPRLPEVLEWANCTLDANLIKLSMDPEVGGKCGWGCPGLTCSC
jgi:hypothetical protein